MSQSILEREYEVRPKKQGGGMGLTSEEAAALLKEYGENTLLSDRKRVWKQEQKELAKKYWQIAERLKIWRRKNWWH